MRLQKHLNESYDQDLKFAKKRLLMFIDDIEHNINVMRKSKIKDNTQTKALEKIYKELDKKTKEVEATIKNAWSPVVRKDQEKSCSMHGV